MIDDDDDAVLAALRKRAERRALEVGLAMLDDPKAKDTAKSSVVRAFLADAVQRRDEDDLNLQPHQMTAAQLDLSLRRGEARLAALRGEIEDAELVPASRGVFD